MIPAQFSPNMLPADNRVHRVYFLLVVNLISDDCSGVSRQSEGSVILLGTSARISGLDLDLQGLQPSAHHFSLPRPHPLPFFSHNFRLSRFSLNVAYGI